jgi:hypothetical protein
MVSSYGGGHITLQSELGMSDLRLSRWWLMTDDLCLLQCDAILCRKCTSIYPASHAKRQRSSWATDIPGVLFWKSCETSYSPCFTTIWNLFSYPILNLSGLSRSVAAFGRFVKGAACTWTLKFVVYSTTEVSKYLLPHTNKLNKDEIKKYLRCVNQEIVTTDWKSSWDT